jgi:predicted Rossmann fold flavoprotein
MFDLLVIGGGAAGFFGAIQAAEQNQQLSIAIVEKTSKVLSKVKISGGVRCNVTHHCFEPKPLASHYPRGEKPLRELFKTYQAQDVVEWFEKKGVKLLSEADGRMFPITNDSQTIIDLFLREVSAYKIEVMRNMAVTNLQKRDTHFVIAFEDKTTLKAKKVLVASGGHANPRAYDWLASTGHTIDTPIPSLFTFNDSSKAFKELMGIAVPTAHVRIVGTKFTQKGPLLITHWGLSGPAVIKLSAWAAVYLHEKKYEFTVLVSWMGELQEESVRDKLLDFKSKHVKKRIAGSPLFELPQRLWSKLCELAEIEEEKLWGDLPLKNLNKLLENLIRCRFDISGKTTFKEEFVTCGGVPLQEVELNTMASKLIPDLFFAGEILNIDGETGGFNFQAAWTTAYVAASSIAKA